ncbi:gas vesicle protein GvpK [Streptomyces sp. SLBN-118]|nr:gas vesicle protein GvpK [Streptomyces sp. SLBN-118]
MFVGTAPLPHPLNHRLDIGAPAQPVDPPVGRPGGRRGPLRQLMERQALRRVEVGDLTGAQEERIGLTLMLLEDRMELLREKFGLEPEDLNIDLGPLGPLLPR